MPKPVGTLTLAHCSSSFTPSPHQCLIRRAVPGSPLDGCLPASFPWPLCSPAVAGRVVGQGTRPAIHTWDRGTERQPAEAVRFACSQDSLLGACGQVSPAARLRHTSHSNQTCSMFSSELRSSNQLVQHKQFSGLHSPPPVVAGSALSWLQLGGSSLVGTGRITA